MLETKRMADMLSWDRMPAYKRFQHKAAEDRSTKDANLSTESANTRAIRLLLEHIAERDTTTLDGSATKLLGLLPFV